MAVLNVPNAVASGTAPTERQLDTMRSYLLNFFNGGQLDENNIADGGITYSKIGAAPDDVSLKFTDNTASIMYDADNDALLIRSAGAILFGVLGETPLLEVKTDGALAPKGYFNFNTGTGNQTFTTQHLLTRYKKPKLVYSDSNIVTIEANGSSSTETLVALPDRMVTIYDRTCSLSVSSNGAGEGNSGTAVSGRASGITRKNNTWFYIYAVLVQGGSQANGSNAILVATYDPPTSGYITALDTQFGVDKWTYIGCVRNGYNDSESSDGIILPFVYDDTGFCHFYTASDTNEGAGVTLKEALTTDNLEWEMEFQSSSATGLPHTATRAIFNGYREANGHEFHFRSTANDQNHLIATGLYHVSGLSTLYACVQLEVPVIENYKLVVTNGNVETWCRITLAGFQDHFA